MRAFSLVSLLLAFVALFAAADARAGGPPIGFKPPIELARASNPGPSAPGVYTASLRLTGTDGAGKAWSYEGAIASLSQPGFGHVVLQLDAPLPAGVTLQGAMIVFMANDASNPAHRILLGAPKAAGAGASVTITYQTMTWTWTKGGVSKSATWTEGG